MLTSAHLPDLAQRREAIEFMGVVIGTAGTSAYVHLQLETLRRMFGTSMPTLIVNDGPADESLKALATEYGVTLAEFPDRLGHSAGDIRVFVTGFEWAKERGVDIMVKLSRRFIPLVNWRHQLQVLAAAHINAAIFNRRHNDRADGMFRTDCIACRVKNFDNDKTKAILAEAMTKERVNVEPMFESFARMNGGWVMWDLLGESFYKPHAKAMQWRGLLPFHYTDLAREYGLPYTDEDFHQGLIPIEQPSAGPSKTSNAVALEILAPPESA